MKRRNLVCGSLLLIASTTACSNSDNPEGYADIWLSLVSSPDRYVSVAEAKRRSEAAFRVHDFNGEAYWTLIAALHGDAQSQAAYAYFLHVTTNFPERPTYPFRGPRDLIRIDPTPKGQDRAIYWATQAANQGYANAMYLLAVMYGATDSNTPSVNAVHHVYPDGTFPYVPNPELAYYWMKRAGSANPPNQAAIAWVRDADVGRAGVNNSLPPLRQFRSPPDQ